MRIIIKSKRTDMFLEETSFLIKVVILKREFKFNVEKQMIKPSGLNALFG